MVEYGRSAGANVNIAIKSGTRDLHGTAYWYVRNDKFDANPWFNNFDGQPKGAFRQNQYGANIGGPAIKNKTFYFFSWEGYRRSRANTQRLTTPTSAIRAPSSSFVPEEPVSRFSTGLRALLRFELGVAGNR